MATSTKRTATVRTYQVVYAPGGIGERIERALAEVRRMNEVLRRNKELLERLEQRSARR